MISDQSFLKESDVERRGVPYSKGKKWVAGELGGYLAAARGAHGL